MSSGVNKVILIGRLGKDPEAREIDDETEVVVLSLATSETWREMSGKTREKTQWHRVVIWNQKLCEIAKDRLRKGSAVYLEGQLEYRSYTDREGHQKFVTEVVIGRYRGDIVVLDKEENPVRNRNINPDDEIPL